MKHFITIIMVITFSLTLTLTSHAKNNNEKSNNGNHYAYGHNKKCCDCKIDMDMVALIVQQAVRNALDEAEADRLALEASNSVPMQMTSYGATAEEVSFTEYEMEPRRVMIHKISDDANFNAGYAGVDIIYYSKDQQVINEVLDSVDENYDVTVVVKTESGREIHFTSNVNMETVEKDGWDKFVTIAK